jgi:hypothetical protein
MGTKERRKIFETNNHYYRHIKYVKDWEWNDSVNYNLMILRVLEVEVGSEMSGFWV